MTSSKKTPKKKPSTKFKDFKPGKHVRGGLNPQPLPPLKWKMM